MAKLTEDDVRYIREAYIPKAKGQKCNRKEIAEMFGSFSKFDFKDCKRSCVDTCLT